MIENISQLFKKIEDGLRAVTQTKSKIEAAQRAQEDNKLPAEEPIGIENSITTDPLSDKTTE